MSAILPHMCDLSANLECRSETCCTRLAENTERKMMQKSPSAHHRTTLSGYIFATKARIDNRKNLLNSNISSRCPHNMVNFGPLAAVIGAVVWGRSCKFQRVSRLSSVTARHWASVKLCGVEERAPRIFGSVVITLGICPHF